MAVVCACLTTLRPLFVGLDLKILSSFRWTSRRGASFSLAKSKGPWSDGRDGSDSDPIKGRITPQWERREDDTELVKLEQGFNAETQRTTESMNSAESSNRGHSWLGEGKSTTARVRVEECFV